MLPVEAGDAKSSLQEWAQSQGLALPIYTEIHRVGPDHAPKFTSEVRVDAKRAARGTGASKRAAEQEAAAALLHRVRKAIIMSEDQNEKRQSGMTKRCGFVAVVGAPNAGKSTLVNTLVGTKVTIVSHKVQTTRVPIRGIVMVGQSQLVFIDTPGIFKPRRRLDRAMVGAAWNGANDADAVIFLFDCQAPVDAETRQIVERLGSIRGRRILALNKLDLVKKERFLEIAQALECAYRLRCYVHDLGLEGQRRRGSESISGSCRAGGAMALRRG